jgi:hypothetical protein
LRRGAIVPPLPASEIPHQIRETRRKSDALLTHDFRQRDRRYLHAEGTTEREFERDVDLIMRMRRFNLKLS